MKVVLLIVLTALSLNVRAESDQFYIVDGKKTESKVEAIKSLIVNPGSQVYSCSAQELSSKATLKKK